MAGLEILFSTVQKDLKSRQDTIVCCAHWCLVTHGFKCVGLGEEAPASSSDVQRSEMLPAGWNSSQELYSMLYWPNDSQKTHVLKVIVIGDELLVHYMRLEDEKVSNMTINTREYTTEDCSSFSSAYRNLEELQRRFQSELVEALCPKATSSRVSQSQSSQLRRSQEQSRSRDRDPDDPLRVPPRHAERQPPLVDPFAVGRGDLDPFSGGMGGGMMMDPMRGGFPAPGRGMDPSVGLPGRLPRGAVPPGARFDPFGPPDLDRSGNPRGGGGGRAGPDPDHLPPPGYDDMFM